MESRPMCHHHTAPIEDLEERLEVHADEDEELPSFANETTDVDQDLLEADD